MASTARTMPVNVSYDHIDDNRGVFAASIHGGTIVGAQHNHNYFNPKPIERRRTTVEMRAKVLNWLCPQATRDNLTTPAETRRAKKFHPDAGRRFLESDIFTRWLGTDSAEDSIRRLWCMGSPGAGKTFLASRAQSHLAHLDSQFRGSGGKSGVAFLYLNYQYPSDVHQLLGCLVRQLMESLPTLPDDVKVQCETYSKDNASMGQPDLTSLLQKAVDGRLTHIVVDALDECLASTRLSLMEALKSLPGEVRLMITSRYVGDFELLFAGYHRIKISADPADVSDYIDYCIDESPRLRQFAAVEKSLRPDIHKRVLENSQNMFLLVRLHMESLDAAVLSDEVRSILETLSNEINDIYDDIIKRIEQQPATRRTLALKTLGWIAIAARPLSMEELQHALAVDIGEMVFKPGRKPLVDDLVGFCCGFIVVGQSNTAQLVHYTAKTYMRNIGLGRDAFKGFHATMAAVCATYMCIPRLEMPDDPMRQTSSAVDLYDDPDEYSEHEIFDIQRHQTDPESYQQEGKPLSFWTKLRAYPLARYAAVYLGHHLRLIEDLESDEAVKALELTATALKERPKRNFYNRLLWHADVYPPPFMESELTNYLPRPGHTRYTDLIISDDDLSEGSDPSEYDSDDDSSSNSSEVYGNGLAELFEPDDRSDDVSDPAESVASLSGRSNQDDEQTQSPGSDASSYSEGIIDPVPQFESGQSYHFPDITPLHVAAHIGLPALAKAFLSEPSMIQAADQYGYTPLAIALQCRHREVVTMLLDAGASIDVRSKLGCRILLFAAQSIDRCDALATSVLDRAAGVYNASPQAGNIAAELWLWLAAWLAILFHIDVQSTAQTTMRYSKPPHSPQRDLGAERWFVADRQTRPTLWPGHGDDYLKLAWAANRGDCNTISSLINEKRVLADKKKADPTSRILENLALFLAVEGNHMDAIRLLVDHGIDINSEDYNGHTPLHRASVRKNPEMVTFLLALGADIWREDGRWLTPWDLAAKTQCLQVCKILVQNGANVNHKGEDGVHLIYQAASIGNATEVRFLLDLDVNPSILTDYGWAPLHWAANNGHVEVVRMLLDGGADVNPVSDQHKAPLDMAIDTGNKEIEEMLRGGGAMRASDILDRKGVMY